MNKEKKIYVAGHKGMVGSAIVRALQANGFGNIIGRTSKELDLRNQDQVYTFFKDERPDYVFLAAAKVGGIHANNTYRADFLYDNLMIEANVIHASYLHKVEKLLFLGSSCIYPKFADQPIREEALLQGSLEPTNEPYAIAKIAGIKLCNSYRSQHGCRFISAMPTNLYGPGDNYHLENSHVIPALLRKVHSAKINGDPYISIWGTGKPLREFMHVDDLAAACLFLMERYDGEKHINIGSGQEISILDLTRLIMDIVGYNGDIVHDRSKPDGTPRKLMDSTRLQQLGFSPAISLRDGLAATYTVFKDEVAENNE